jgi:hypothetical protein
VAGLLLSNRLSAAATTSYGEDRAQIEDLQARYLFALDFHDPQLYASTFTADGILDYGEGDVKGREAIIKVIAGMPDNRPSPPTFSTPDDGKPALRPGRHQITNIVLKITGNRAAADPNGSISETTTLSEPTRLAASATTRTN